MNWRILAPIVALAQAALIFSVYWDVVGSPPGRIFLLVSSGLIVVYYLGYTHALVQESNKVIESMQQYIVAQTIAVSMMKTAEEVLCDATLAEYKSRLNENIRASEEELEKIGVEIKEKPHDA